MTSCSPVNDKEPLASMGAFRKLGSQLDPPWRNGISHAASCRLFAGGVEEAVGEVGGFVQEFIEKTAVLLHFPFPPPILFSETGYNSAVNFGRSEACK